MPTPPKTKPATRAKSARGKPRAPSRASTRAQVLRRLQEAHHILHGATASLDGLAMRIHGAPPDSEQLVNALVATREARRRLDEALAVPAMQALGRALDEMLAAGVPLAARLAPAAPPRRPKAR